MHRLLAPWLAQRPRRFLRGKHRPIVESLDSRQLLSTYPSAIMPLAPNTVSPVTSVAMQAAVPARPFVQRLANLPFRSQGGRRLTLDVYLPPGQVTGTRPAIVALHGGGWRRYSKEEFGPRAAVFAQQGYVVIAPNYTLSRPGVGSWPANFEDARAAVAWVRANATKYGIDPNRIAAVGESAGGHLAELLGTYTEYPDGLADQARVGAVVALAGPSDLTTLPAQSRQGAGLAVTQMLGGPKRQALLAGVASPIAHVSSSSAPMLLVHGQSDLLVPPDQSVAMVQALQKAGVTARLLPVNAGHVLNFRVGGQDLVPTVLQFLDAAFRAQRPGPLASATTAPR
jgi:acetyl esterase/lipase